MRRFLRRPTRSDIAAIALGVLALIGSIYATDARAQRQFSNFLTLLGTNATGSPSIRAQGTATDISINLVPKGAGTVQVNGTPIVISGGTVTSLTISPGPLAVTGTTNLTGPLFVTPGTSASLKQVGAVRIFHTTADAPTVGTTLETLYTFSVPAATLSDDGSSLHVLAAATVAANANNKTWLLTFGATTVVSTGAAGFNGTLLTLDCWIFRTGAATQKAVCTIFQNNQASVVAAQSIATLSTPAETLSGAITMLLRATTPTAPADLTARYLTVDWHPKGQ